MPKIFFRTKREDESKIASSATYNHLSPQLLQKIIETEKKFVTEVIDAYCRWAKEPDPVVLWDIDTMTTGILTDRGAEELTGSSRCNAHRS